MQSNTSWQQFFQAITDVERNVFPSDHRFVLAQRKLEELVSSVKQISVNDLQVTTHKEKCYYPHRFGPVWKRLQKLEQKHHVYLEYSENNVYIYQCAAVTISDSRTHATVTVYCWVALSADREAKDVYESLLEDHHEIRADALMKNPYFVVEGISSIITTDSKEIRNFVHDVLTEKK